MNNYTQILYQIVFGTAERKKVLLKEGREELFMYLSGVLRQRKCHLYQINGVEDHIHVITHLHPTVALSDLVKDMKSGSSRWIKEKRLFPRFEGWQDGYAAFTYDVSAKNNLIEYVKNQEVHHRMVSYQEELISIIKEQGISFDERYLN